jgi:uncharacterized repeat protein (TIGR01451 family)
VTVTGTLPADYADATVTTSATASSPTADPNAANSTATSLVPVQAGADVSIQINGPAGTVVAGQPITWTVVATNNGPSVARQVVATTEPPAGFPAPVVAGLVLPVTCDGLPTCDIGDMAPGDTATYTVTRTMPPGYPADQVVAIATVRTATADPIPANDVSTATNPVIRGADLSLVKTVSPDPVQPGQPLTYTLTVANAGPSDATAVTVLDSLPDGLLNVTATSDVGSCTLAGTVVTCQADTVPAGGGMVVTITAVLGETAPAGPVTNSATVSSATADPDLSNNTSTVNPPTVGADLSITKVPVADTATPGGAFSWTVTVTNTGPGAARAVEITDSLPPGVSGATAVVDGGAGTCTADTTVICQLGTLLSGATVSVTITVTVDPTTQGMLVNAALVSSPDETNAADNLAQAVTTVAEAVDVGVVKTVIGEVVAGAPVTWSLLVSNAGPAAATGVVLTDALPDGVTVTTVPAGCALDGTTLTCAIGDLAVLGSTTVELTGALDPAARGPVANTADVISDQIDLDPSDNTSTATSDIAVRSAVSATKKADTGAVTVGGSVLYTVTVANAGPSTATDVSVAEQLPAGATLISVTANRGTVDPATLVWSIGTLAAGDTDAVLSVQVRLDTTGTATNTVTVSSPDLAEPVVASADVVVQPAEGGTPPPPDGGAPPPPPPAPGAPGSGSMPNTGLPADVLSGWSATLLLLGAALLLLVRRRRSDR